jgi:hypothetical protein
MINQFLNIEGVEVVTAASVMEEVEGLLTEIKYLRRQIAFWEMIGNYKLMGEAYQEVTDKETKANELFELACFLAQ